MAGELSKAKFQVGDRVHLDRLPATQDTPGFGTIATVRRGDPNKGEVRRWYYSVDADVPGGVHNCHRDETEMRLVIPMPTDPDEVEQWLAT